jgi:hypothetical protein
VVEGIQKREVRTSDIKEFTPEHTLDYYVERRGENKRSYVFRYKNAIKCDHPTMELTVRGGNTYLCPDCKYTFQITSAFVQPQHHLVIQAGFEIMRFAREHGVDSLQEVWRRPIGQTDGTPHKPVLPEGMSFIDVLTALEDVPADIDQEELAALRDFLWVGPAERKKQIADGQANERALKAGTSDEAEDGEGTEG